jgi:hypothetical protein
MPPPTNCPPIEHRSCTHTTLKAASASLEERHGDESRTIKENAAVRSTRRQTNLTKDTLVLSQVVLKAT